MTAGNETWNPSGHAVGFGLSGDRQQAGGLVDHREPLAELNDRNRRHRFPFLVACALMLSACESEPVTPETPREASPEPISETHVATVSSSGRELAAFVVAVVGDGPGKTAGLSAFAPLGESQGLVLAWDDPTRVCIWNQPVDYPIDVAYVDRERRIVAVEQFEARDTRSRCHDEVVDVLETQLNRLSAARIGDRVVLEPMP